MMTFLIKHFIKNKYDKDTPINIVKKAYADLSCIVGIFINSILSAVKIFIGIVTNSVAILADGINNLSDVATNFVSLMAFRLARYGKGKEHPFGRGRVEWVAGIITAAVVVYVGLRLAETSIKAIIHPSVPTYSTWVVIILILSILTKFYMYLYNKKFSKIADSETLKAIAADCISDSASTFVVLIATLLCHFTSINIDGYCSLLVSLFIFYSGAQSLIDIINRILGEEADDETLNIVTESIKKYPEIVNAQNIMMHDYGMGYYVVNMRVEGYKKNMAKIYEEVHLLSYELFDKYRWDSYIQIDCLINDKNITEKLEKICLDVAAKYSDEIKIDNFRLVDDGKDVNVLLDMHYPAKCQKYEEAIFNDMANEVQKVSPDFHMVINGVLSNKPIKFLPL